jgi:hypothetical protein
VLKAGTVGARHCVEIAANEELIVRGDVSDGGLQKVVEAILVSVRGVLGGSVRNQDGEVAVTMRQSSHE